MKELIKVTMGVALLFVGIVLFLMNGALEMIAGASLGVIGGCMIMNQEEEASE
ncbi:MAG: hypothetical protein IKU36_01855 [Bacteroidales bacterium]|nr:hypothetical protein [Bacteroidales bacterium]